MGSRGRGAPRALAAGAAAGLLVCLLVGLGARAAGRLAGLVVAVNVALGGTAAEDRWPLAVALVAAAGALAALPHAALHDRVRGNRWGLGLAMGVLQGLLVGPLLALVPAPVPDFVPAPGPFATRFGPAGLAAFAASQLLFGLVVAALYRPPRGGPKTEVVAGGRAR